MIRVFIDRMTIQGEPEARDTRVARPIIEVVSPTVLAVPHGLNADALAGYDRELDRSIARDLRREADALALETLPEADERLVRAAFERFDSVSKAAQAIGVGRATLYRRIKALGLTVKE